MSTTESSRRPLMAANWKMHKTPAESAAFIEQLRPQVNDAACDIVVAPPFVCIPAAVHAAGDSVIAISGQNLFWETSGAYTGEVSGAMLQAAGCRYVIIGHSERRQYFQETDETVNRRLQAALKMALIPIVCVGETLQEREAGQTEAVLSRQFEGGLRGLSAAEMQNVVIAYEPVWAIGTGRTASPEMAQEAHAFLRGCIARQFDTRTAAKVRILYGGSVKPDNVAGLMAQADIDGGLVGGASLQVDSFLALVKAAR